MTTQTISGTEYPVLLSRSDAWTAIEAAGLKVWRSEDGKKIRTYDEDGNYCWLSWSHVDGLAIPQVEREGKSCRALRARVSAIVEAAIAAARGAV